MTMAGMILGRLAIMLVYMIPGFILYKTKIITDAGSKEIGKYLLYIILPAAIIKSYNIEFTADKAVGLLISMLAAVVALLLAMGVSHLIFGSRHAIENFGAAFSNAGFMGIPLVQAVIGDEGVYYAAAFVAMLNILQWTYGVYIMTQNKTVISAKKIIFNPILVSFLIGIVLFLLPVSLPSFFTDILNTVASMNAPIAMLTVGVYLAQVPLKEVFLQPVGYKVSAVRLLLIPLLTSALLAVLPVGDYALKQTILILAAAPIGSNVAVYAQLYGCDYKQAVKEVVLSTLLCIISMPVVIGISDYILQNIPL